MAKPCCAIIFSDDPRRVIDALGEGGLGLYPTLRVECVHCGCVVYTNANAEMVSICPMCKKSGGKVTPLQPYDDWYRQQQLAHSSVG